MFIFFYRRTPETQSMLGHGFDALAVGGGALAVGVSAERLGAPGFVVGPIVIAFVLAYALLPFRYFGGTPGQRLFRVHVVTADGAPLSWSHVLKRLGMQLVEVALMMITGPFGFIGLWLYQRKHGCWLHDSVARTRVIWSSQREWLPVPPPVPASPEQKKLRARVIAITACAMVVLFASTMTFEHFFTSGSLHVVAPSDSELRVTVDDQPEVMLSRGEHAAFKVARGEHTVVLDVDGVTTTKSVEVSGGQWTGLLRSSPDQCFVRLNVSRSHYLNGCEVLPDLEERYDAEAIDLGWPADRTFFSENDLPGGLRQYVNLVEQVPCTAIGYSDDALLRDILGFEGRPFAGR